MADSAEFDLVISIINYRTSELTVACIESVIADFDGINGHIMVVDNASGDGSDEVIAQWIATQPAGTPVTLVRSPINGGFSAGHNQGIGPHKAKYYLILNSDAVLRPGFCAEILHAADADPKAGLLAPRIEYDDGEAQISHFRNHSPLSELIRAARSGPITKLLSRHVVAPTDGLPAAQIDWVSFACVLVRGEMVDQIGPMDEGYFLYFEDAEYCLRAKRAGWGIALAPKAVAVHFRGGSGPVKSLEKAKKRLPGYFYHSRARLLCQAHGHVGLIAANLCWHLGRGAAQLRRLFGKPVPAVAAHEARDIWINTRSPLTPYKHPES